MKPSEVQTTKTFFLISGIFNILVFLGWGGTTLFAGFITCGLGCLLGIIPLINVVSATMDFIGYNKLSKLNTGGTFNSSQLAATFEIMSILTGNLVSFILGIISLSNVNSDNFKNFLKERNIF